MQEIAKDQTTLAPVAETMVYTPQSYLDAFNRSYKSDGLQLRPLNTHAGAAWRMLVTSDPKGVWKLSAAEVL